MTVMTSVILSSSLDESYQCLHLDTSDHRPIENVGKLDVRNLVLGLRAAFSMAWIVGRVGVDLVYLPIAKHRLAFLRDALFLVVARIGGKVTVVHLHAEGFSEFRQSQPRWVQHVIRVSLKSDRVHAIVLGDRLRHGFDGLIPDSRVHVLPNGISDIGSDGGGGTAPGPTVLYLATLWSAKGLFELLESAARLRRQIPDLRVVVAGDWYSPTEAEAGRRFIAENDLGDCIRMLGPVGPEAKHRLLSSASVFALPSYTEGQPLVILEALSAGLPIVATRVGALPETIADGVEGYLVDVGDVDALTDRLHRVLDSPSLRDEMARRARARYEREFTVERFAEGLGAVWRLAAGDPAVHPSDGGTTKDFGAAAV
jgi:glycosyltransferase involved in cell wall biosynthesis